MHGWMCVEESLQQHSTSEGGTFSLALPCMISTRSAGDPINNIKITIIIT